MTTSHGRPNNAYPEISGQAPAEIAQRTNPISGNGNMKNIIAALIIAIGLCVAAWILACGTRYTLAGEFRAFDHWTGKTHTDTAGQIKALLEK